MTKQPRVLKILRHPHFQRIFHGSSAIFACVASVPIMIWMRDWIWVLMVISLWTWISGEFAAWLAAMAADPAD